MPDCDPHGKNQHDVGAKLDKDKPRADLVLGGFANALKMVIEIGTYGANKYTDEGWMHVPNGQKRYADAAMRHYLNLKAEGPLDKESGLPHLAHLAWNVLAQLELHVRKEKTKGGKHR